MSHILMFFTLCTWVRVCEKRESGLKWMSRSSSPQDVRGGNTNTASDCVSEVAPPPPTATHSAWVRSHHGLSPPTVTRPLSFSLSLLRRLAGWVLKCKTGSTSRKRISATDNYDECGDLPPISQKRCKVVVPLVLPLLLQECTSAVCTASCPRFLPHKCRSYLSFAPSVWSY